MTTMKTIFTIALIGSFTLFSCDADDGLTYPDPEPVSPCESAPQKMLAMYMDPDGGSNADIKYLSYDINDFNTSPPNVIGNITPTAAVNGELSTSGTIYDENSNLHGIVITRPQAYFTFNTATNTAEEYSLSEPISAPVMLGNTAYAIEVANYGYAVFGEDEHYEIKPFNIINADAGTALPIPASDRTFDNSSFFNHESMSSASNGIDELYFVSGPNLVTVNVSNNSASYVDLYPNFTFSDYVTFIGLEYSESLGLLAIRIYTDPDPNVPKIQEVVKIDPTDGSYTVLSTVPEIINTEYYTTAYRECDQKYYLTTWDYTSSVQETLYYEFDLNTNSLSNTASLPFYTFGITPIH